MNASHHPGRARRLRAALALLGLAALACRPKLPPVSGCTPRSHRCEADSPEVCSPSQRWHRVGDLPCAAVGARCAVLDAGVAACVPLGAGDASAADVTPAAEAVTEPADDASPSPRTPTPAHDGDAE